MKEFIAVLVLLLLLSCQSSKPNFDDPAKNGKVIMRVEKTPCFGTCPVYVATLYSNGLLIYQGKRFTIKSGCNYARVNKAEINKLRTWFKDAGFFNFSNHYPEQDIAPSDLPTTKVFYTEGRYEKEVTDKNWNTPEPLINLERKLDTWVNIQNLQSCDK